MVRSLHTNGAVGGLHESIRVGTGRMSLDATSAIEFIAFLFLRLTEPWGQPATDFGVYDGRSGQVSTEDYRALMRFLQLPILMFSLCEFHWKNSSDSYFKATNLVKTPIARVFHDVFHGILRE